MLNILMSNVNTISNVKHIEEFSLNNYDDQFSAVFYIAGCNFNCHYCHNRELIRKKDYDKMKTISYKKIKAYLEKTKGVIDAVTITGGEPTIHFWDLVELMKLIRSYDLKIKLDTNGSLNPIFFYYLIKNDLFDYVAMDIKTFFDKYYKFIPSNHKETMNILNNVKENIRYIVLYSEESGFDYEFRTTASTLLMDKGDMFKINKFFGDLRKELKMNKRDIKLKRYNIQKISLDDKNFKKHKLLNFSDDDLKFFHKILSENFEVVNLGD